MLGEDIFKKNNKKSSISVNVYLDKNKSQQIKTQNKTRAGLRTWETTQKRGKEGGKQDE